LRPQKSSAPTAPGNAASSARTMITRRNIKTFSRPKMFAERQV
jgi:hypothetical protein